VPRSSARLADFLVAGGGFRRRNRGRSERLPPEAIRFYRTERGSGARDAGRGGSRDPPELGRSSVTTRNASCRAQDRRRVHTAGARGDGAGRRAQRRDARAASTIVWTAGTVPTSACALPCARERGRVVANGFMEVPEWPGVWAWRLRARAGPGRQAYPPTAQHALRQAKLLARNIRRACAGAEAAVHVQDDRPARGDRPPYRRRSDLGVNFSRFIAWWRRSIYLSSCHASSAKCRASDWTPRPVLRERPRAVPTRLAYSDRGREGDDSARRSAAERA